MSTSLFVPVDLQALCVGRQDVNGENHTPAYGTVHFAQVAADFSALPYLDEERTAQNEGPALSETVLPDYFSPTNDPLETGVHLHWALPDALTHGAPNEAGTLEFPEVPNRWLVVRIMSNEDQPTLNAWMVASDHLWDKDTEGANVQNRVSRAVPLHLPDNLPNKAFQTLGKVTPWASWTEPETDNSLAKHTTVGYGEVTYAAAYVHSQNVFGFYDPLVGYTDDEDTSYDLAYLLVGWYSEEGKDPLRQLDFPADASDEEKLDFLQKTF